MVYLYNRGKYPEIYYFQKNSNVVFDRNGLVEVCHELNPDKLKRKLGGLWEAMRFSDKKTAMLITLEQVD